MKVTVLSTKLLEPELVSAARESGMEVVEQEFIHIRPMWSEQVAKQVSDVLKQGVKALVFTSANAVQAMERYLTASDMEFVHNCPIYCLSGKTKASLAKIGLEKNIAGEADHATALAQKMIEKQVRAALFFCGNQRRDELPDTLKAAGITVHELQVYETKQVPVVAGDVDAVLFFSPSAVQSFFSANQLKGKAVCFAIGATTAQAIRQCTGNRIVVSDTPTQKALMASLHDYFQNKNFY